MANVKMRVQISGTRDGKDWPAPGQMLTVSDAEAADLIRNGMAVDPAAKPVEDASADVLGVETAVAPPKGNKAVNARAVNKARKEA